MLKQILLTPGIDTYNTVEELESYANRVGISLPFDGVTALKQAMKQNESRNYSGSKTNPGQALEFPRNGNNRIPGSIKKAQLVAACLVSADESDDDIDPIWGKASSGAVESPELEALLKPFISNEQTDND